MSLAKKLEVVRETGVNHALVFPYIADLGDNTPDSLEGRRDLVFVGGFRHAPNADGMRHFLKEVWPLMAGRLPQDARLVVVGHSVPKDLLALADDRIVFTGHLPSLVSVFARARVAIAPLRYGAGIKGKVVQYMAHGLPSVVSTVAAEGIGVKSEKEVLIAESAQDFASGIARLYADDTLWWSMRRAGMDYVTKNYSAEQGIELCQEAARIAEAMRAERVARSGRERLEQALSQDRVAIVDRSDERQHQGERPISPKRRLS